MIDLGGSAPGNNSGEANIRVSGNLLLAAARVTGIAGISVKGSTTDAPTVSVASPGLDVEIVSVGGSIDEDKGRRGS